MNAKKGLICLLIAAILTFCVPDVAATSTVKYSTDVHSDRVTYVRGQLETRHYVALSEPDSNTAAEVSNYIVATHKMASLEGFHIKSTHSTARTDWIDPAGKFIIKCPVIETPGRYNHS